MAAFISMLRRQKKKKEKEKVGFGDFTFFQLPPPPPPPPIPKNVKTGNATTTYKMVDGLWLYTDNTSMLKRSMPK